ncbi:uncharacterized protein LOC114530749 [Dendronephthya gigantea]|uniref:uncharacterized protein LOC114530749 n=1 Tax=Dendronephthya gigantea TaxID=151771 RepID=UPI00106A99B9|nr:uncharacterized protein LOC114530749 [Dendronephthya gigantea]
MLEFIMDNPVLWNVTDYRRKDKKEKIWEEQAHQMNKTVDMLKGWFRSLRDTHTRLDKKKSGDSAPNLTEREQWILSKFAFLKTVTRHRPEPMQSVKETIQLHRGDLNAAESACADMQDVLDEVTPLEDLPLEGPTSDLRTQRVTSLRLYRKELLSLAPSSKTSTKLNNSPLQHKVSLQIMLKRAF